MLLEAYKDFVNFFSIKNAGYLALYEDYNHVLNFINNK